jgi:hypothetical protein
MSDINENTSAFRPDTTATVSLSAATTSAGVGIPSSNINGAGNQGGLGSGYNAVQVYNSGAVVAFVNIVPTSQANGAAKVPNGATAGDYPVAPGAVIVISVANGPKPFTAYAITASGTATVYFSPGHGV